MMVSPLGERMKNWDIMCHGGRADPYALFDLGKRRAR